MRDAQITAVAGGAKPLSAARPTEVQRAWLVRGVNQPGGKLPLFDESGRRIDPRTIRRSLDEGWAEPRFVKPVKPDWLVCRLTEKGRAALGKR